jgi:hypothetical protein
VGFDLDLHFKVKIQKIIPDSLKIFSMTASSKLKAVSLSEGGPFQSLFKSTSCEQYFYDYDSEVMKVKLRSKTIKIALYLKSPGP